MEKCEKIYVKFIVLLIALLTLFVSHVLGQDKKKQEQDYYLYIKGRVQTRIMLGEKETKFAQNRNYDAVDFNFRRIRLALQFQNTHWYGGIIDLKLENLLTDGLNAKSAIQEANIWFKPGFWGTKLKLGQFKLPFLREQITSSSRHLIPERSFSANTLQQSDIGMLLSTYPLHLFGGALKKNVVFGFSITNGDGSGQDGEGLKSVEANSTGEPILPLYNWRLQYNPLGGSSKGYSGWTNRKEIFENKTAFSIGVAGAYNASNEGNSLSGGNLIGHTIDMTFYAASVYVNNAYTVFHGNAVPNQYHTFQITLGYNIPIFQVYLMPTLRYNYLQQDSNQNGVIDLSEQFHDVWAGFNFFGDHHNFKLQFFYQIRFDHASKNSINKNKEDNLIYFQVQINFKHKAI